MIRLKMVGHGQDLGGYVEAGIDHVIVLMLENRSFDHLLGYADDALDGIADPPPTNPTDPADPNSALIAASDTASRTLDVDPDHSHEAVMLQVLGDSSRRRPPYTPTNKGFVRSYERKATGEQPERDAGWFANLLAMLAELWRRVTGRATPPESSGVGPEIMACFARDSLEGFHTLARHYGTCERWFSPLPGETWPNRNFAVAGTSSGDVNITLEPYFNRTIFDALDEQDVSWRIYHEGPAHLHVFPELWADPDRRSRWQSIGELLAAIGTGDSDALAAVSYIEPDHGTLDDTSNSMHPGNNTTTDDDFIGGEQLMVSIYEALRAQPDLFDRTLFLVTFDEHGGFFDHVPPPTNAVAPDSKVTADGFDFTMYGPRVPAIVINPRCRSTVDRDVRDHTTILSTIGRVFNVSLDGLGARAIEMPHLLGLLDDTAPTDPLPDLGHLLSSDSGVAARPEVAEAPEVARTRARRRTSPVADLDDFQASLLSVSARLDEYLDAEATGADSAALREILHHSHVDPAAANVDVDATATRFKASASEGK